MRLLTKIPGACCELLAVLAAILSKVWQPRWCAAIVAVLGMFGGKAGGVQIASDFTLTPG